MSYAFWAVLIIVREGMIFCDKGASPIFADLASIVPEK
jgi:hypothetical protein